MPLHPRGCVFRFVFRDASLDEFGAIHLRAVGWDCVCARLAGSQLPLPPLPSPASLPHLTHSCVYLFYVSHRLPLSAWYQLVNTVPVPCQPFPLPLSHDTLIVSVRPTPHPPAPRLLCSACVCVRLYPPVCIPGRRCRALFHLFSRFNWHSPSYGVKLMAKIGSPCGCGCVCVRRNLIRASAWSA